MANNSVKNIYVLNVLGKNFFVGYDGKNIKLYSNGIIDTNSLEYLISEYINRELVYYNDSVENLRTFLPELQKVINSSSKSVILNNIRDFFVNNTNIFTSDVQNSDNSEENVIVEETSDNTEENIIVEETSGNEFESRSKGKQKVLSNGKSLLDNNQNAYVSALVLALLVEISGLVIFTMFLFKIM